MSTLLNRIRPLMAAVGLSLSFGLALPATAQEFSPEQKKSIEGVIRVYLLKNPEVLQEALVELEKRQQDSQRMAQRLLACVERDDPDLLRDAPAGGDPIERLRQALSAEKL